jgi:putative hydrolase of the HAD superfamily
MALTSTKFNNIIFDLGGVILNIDYNATVKAFEPLGIGHFENLFSQASQTSLFDKYEKGLISSEEFRAQLRPYLKEDTDDAMIDKAWNAILLDLPEQRIKILKKLREKYRTFLLSNTNDIHIRTINKYLEKEFGMKDLSSLFEKVYFSYEIGKRKPDAEIFQHVVDENNISIHDTLFIDDSKQHIATAQAMGFQAYLLDPSREDITELFAPVLVS